MRCIWCGGRRDFPSSRAKPSAARRSRGTFSRRSAVCRSREGPSTRPLGPWSGRRTMKSTPYLLTLPALLLFAAVVIVPLAMTVLLSFHDWGQYKGIEPVFILKNWREVLTDSYYGEMFGRTFRIAAIVTVLAAVF